MREETVVEFIELEPKFRRIATRGDEYAIHERPCSIADAHGVRFLCPACLRMNKGPMGTHSIVVWFADRDVPAEAVPPPRWHASGSGLHDLTLAPSIQLQSGCRWHGFITAGRVTGV
jgi:hypothetical protein